MNNTLATVATDEDKEYETFGAIFIQFIIEIYEFLKYIFNDMWLGKAPM